MRTSSIFISPFVHFLPAAEEKILDFHWICVSNFSRKTSGKGWWWFDLLFKHFWADLFLIFNGAFVARKAPKFCQKVKLTSGANSLFCLIFYPDFWQQNLRRLKSNGNQPRHITRNTFLFHFIEKKKLIENIQRRIFFRLRPIIENKWDFELVGETCAHRQNQRHIESVTQISIKTFSMKCND